MKRSLLLLVPVLFMIIAGCNPSVNTASDPRKAVIEMFKAIENNDREKLAHYLDFETLLKTGENDYALKMDSVRKFTNPQEILDDLLQGGLTNQRWLAMQRIVGSGSQLNDSALVEVSFINKATSTQYYNKFGLRKVNGVWKVYSFSVPNDK
jgi:hypothetical protein